MNKIVLYKHYQLVNNHLFCQLSNVIINLDYCINLFMGNNLLYIYDQIWENIHSSHSDVAHLEIHKYNKDWYTDLTFWEVRKEW